MISYIILVKSFTKNHSDSVYKVFLNKEKALKEYERLENKFPDCYTIWKCPIEDGED